MNNLNDAKNCVRSADDPCVGVQRAESLADAEDLTLTYPDPIAIMTTGAKRWPDL